MILYYIRHGDPTYNPDQLTPLGKRQAEAVARRLSQYGLDEIYVSSSNRAQETCRPTCEILKKEPDTTLFLFSDDLPYCDAHRKEMGLELPEKVVFIEGNSGDSAFRDMQLMSHCKNMIVGNSSFPFMASLLNRDVKTILTFRNDRYI